MVSPVITERELDAVSRIVGFVNDFCDHDDAIKEMYGEDGENALRLLDKLHKSLSVRA
jgi:hypothetical protein